MKHKIPIVLTLLLALVACGSKTPSNDEGKTNPPDDSGQVTPPDGGQVTPPDDGGQTNPPDDGGQTTPAEVTSLRASLEKLTYYVGDTLDYEHIVVTLNKSDNTSSNVNYSDFTSNGIALKLLDSSQSEISYLNPFTNSGSYTLSVYLVDKTDISDTKSITINQVVMSSITLNYDKTSYFEFETLDLSNLTVTITYNNGSEVTISYSQLESYGFAIKLLDSSNQEVDFSRELDIGTYTLKVISTDGELHQEKTISVIEEDFGVIGNEALESITNPFIFANEEYTASECRSLKIFDGYFNKGTYKVSLSRSGNTYDDHLIFAYNPTNHSYYSYGLNMMNKLQITYFDGQHLRLVKAFDTAITTKASLAVAFDSDTGAVDYYLNDEFIYANNISVEGNLKYGIYGGTKGCVFSEISLNDDDTYYDNVFANYQTANGTITNSNGKFVVSAASSLNYHKSKTFTHGDISVVFNANNSSSTLGLAFCIDSNGKTTFYRDDDVSYYYLCITINGTLGLYRVTNGAASLMKNMNTKEYYKDQDHVLKAIRDNNNNIHVFLDDTYYFSCVDRHPLKGDKFGISSTASSSVFHHMSIKTTFSSTNDLINDYDIASGSFYKNGHLIVSNAKNSLIIKKQPGSYNGTIETEVSLGRNYGTGVVFRLTKPESQTFYESEEGLSYYWLDIKNSSRIILGKVNNGSVTWQTEKYMPSFMAQGAKCKIVLNGNHIYAYYSNILIYHYVDNNPLTGLYYGFRSDSEGAAINGGITFSDSTDLEQHRYLIFGHSYTQLWHRHKEDFAELGSDITSIGLGGSQNGTWLRYIDEVAVYNPEWGIYWNGINDIDADVAIDTIISNCTSVLTGIKAKVPNFKCVVISAARCTHEKPMARLDKISEHNQKLKALCDSKDWLVYVEVETIFCDSEGNPIDSYFVDKLHPTAAGYKLVAPLVVSAIKKLSRVKEELMMRKKIIFIPLFLGLFLLANALPIKHTNRDVSVATPSYTSRIEKYRLEAIDDLNSVDYTLYRSNEVSELQALLTTTINKINNSEDTNEIDSIVSSYNRYVLTFKTDAQLTEEEQSLVPASDIYYISSLDDLLEFRDDVNSGYSYSGDTVVLTTDITIPSGTAFGDCIGKAETCAFSGTFDGGNHTISGFKQNVSGVYPALFAFVTNGTIKNLKMADVNITSTATQRAAAFVARANNLVIENCHTLSGTITGKKQIGGVVAFSLGELLIQNCSNAATINGQGDAIGGILGSTHNDAPTKIIKNCINTGSVNNTQSGTTGTGGIIGSNIGNSSNILKIIDCVNEGAISGISYVGGIIGIGRAALLSDSVISNCVNKGNITGTGSTAWGGVAGFSRFNISNCACLYSVTIKGNAASTLSAVGCTISGGGGASSNSSGYITGGVGNGATQSGGKLINTDGSEYIPS